MTKIKKISCILIVGLMISMSLVGCGGSSDNIVVGTTTVYDENVNSKEETTLSSAEDEKSTEESTEDKEEKTLENCEVGDSIYFGEYMQSSANEKEAIEWMVLAKEEDKALLMSKKILQYVTCKGMDYVEAPELEELRWSNSEERKWLNDTFINEAFSDEEKNQILFTTVSTSYVIDFGSIIEYVEKTSDKAFLLDVTELGYYFENEDDNLKSEETEYARLNCKHENTSEYWMLRSACGGSGNHFSVDSKRNRVYASDNNLSFEYGIRPVIWVKLDSYDEDNYLNKDNSVYYNGTVGELIKMGKYKNKDIEWMVLEKKDGKALIVSNSILELRQYNTDDKDITWSNSSMREWLNGSFLSSSFSKEEQDKILISDVVNSEVNERGLSGGEDTQDKIFLLSISEAEKYFTNDYNRIAVYGEAPEECYGYWLRTPGNFGMSRIDLRISLVNGKGGIKDDSLAVGADAETVGVRPAMWITIE